jgi:tetrathionate reductase subunit B
MARYGMVIDLTKCQGCFNCQIACKDEYVENDWPPYSAAQPDTGQFWMHVQERERGSYPWMKVAHIPQPCMQCDNPPCLAGSTGGAGYKRSDGIVIFDPVKSAGQKNMQAQCPYGVVYWNDNLNIPQKCTFCAHLLDRGWTEPRCVQSCPIAAFTFGDLDDPNSDVAKLVAAGTAKPPNPEFATNPRVYYINLPKTFIAGTVVNGSTDDCFEGANVTLKDTASGATMSTTTNNYGDFEFEGLDSGKTYSLTIQASGYTTITQDSIALKTDTYLGELILRKS